MKRNLVILCLILLVTATFTSCNQSNSNTISPTTSPETTYPPPQPESIVSLTAGQAMVLIEDESNLMIIDVSANYDDGHLPGAVQYFLSDGTFGKAIQTFDKTKTYLIYANVSGPTSSIAYGAAERLINAGFEKVYLLSGNLKAWVEAGYPVEK